MDGRKELVTEVQNAPAPVQEHISASFRELLSHSEFITTLPWHLPPDDIGQGRLPALQARLNQLAGLSD